MDGKILRKKDYDVMVSNVVGRKSINNKFLNSIEDIMEYFISEYELYHKSNPNFGFELDEAIENYKAKNSLIIRLSNFSDVERAFNSIKLGLNKSSNPVVQSEKKNRHLQKKRTQIKRKSKTTTSKIKKTNQKTQILVLKELGIFDLPVISKPTLKDRAEFFSRLLNMNIDNTEDYLGNLFDKKGDSGKKSPYNRSSIKQANEILDLLKLPSI